MRVNKEYSSSELDAQARAFKRAYLLKHKDMSFPEALKAVPYGK